MRRGTLRVQAGRRLDGSGLMDFNARYYDPYLNRWLQPDSIVTDPYNPLDSDRYSFVRNNPVNRVDPDTHRSYIDVGENGHCSSFEPFAQYDIKFTDAGLDAYLLYLRASQDSSKWWNKDHSFTQAEYLGLETLWERSDVPEIEGLLIEATTRQLWMRKALFHRGVEEGIIRTVGVPVALLECGTLLESSLVVIWPHALATNLHHIPTSFLVKMKRVLLSERERSVIKY